LCADEFVRPLVSRPRPAHHRKRWAATVHVGLWFNAMANRRPAHRHVKQFVVGVVCSGTRAAPACINYFFTADMLALVPVGQQLFDFAAVRGKWFPDPNNT
jgi:hypothetical protein